MNVYQYDGKKKNNLPLYVRHSGSVMAWECTAASVTESLQDHLWSEADQSASKCKKMMTPPKNSKSNTKVYQGKEEIRYFSTGQVSHQVTEHVFQWWKIKQKTDKPTKKA